MTNLFSPIKIKNVQLKNRIILSPMCQYSCEDGFANDWHLVHYGSRAVGGAGAIISEAIAVCSEGRISPNDLGIWKDEHIPYSKRITNFIEKQGSIPGIQLAHAGRKAGKPRPRKDDNAKGKAAIGWQCYAPSAIPFQDGDAVPVEMSTKEIKKTIQYFQDAAKRARQAGFKKVQGCELLCSRYCQFLLEFANLLRRFRFVSLNWSAAEIMNTYKINNS